MTTENNNVLSSVTGIDLQILVSRYPAVQTILETIILSRLQAEQAYEASNVERKKDKKNAKR